MDQFQKQKMSTDGYGEVKDSDGDVNDYDGDTNDSDGNIKNYDANDCDGDFTEPGGDAYEVIGQGVDPEKLKKALHNMIGTKIIRAGCQTEQLHGGTLGDVRLVTGMAETANGETVPYKLVWKTQGKWERYGDPGSWRREYDLYASELSSLFTRSLRWPKCYLAEMNDDKWQIWMEYIDGVSGMDLTGDMYVRAAEELGRFQGKLYAMQPGILEGLKNLSGADAMEKFYRHYSSWDKLHDYIRSADCVIPKHIREMITGMDEKADEIWRGVEKLPVVFCHRDFWITNIFYSENEIVLIDWDTAGWGHLGEDIVSLIADEADVDHMVEYYYKCVPAYYRGFSEYADISHVSDLYIRQRIILHFGYRLLEWYMNSNSENESQETDGINNIHLATLQKIYEMGDIKF